MGLKKLNSLVTCVFALQAAPLLHTAISSAEIPISGTPVPALAPVEEEMLGFMRAKKIGAGILAVQRDGVVVFGRAYGWKDADQSRPLPPNTIIRVASVSKPITAAAIRKLIAGRKFSLDDRVFKLNNSLTGILEIEPFGNPDLRLKDVTVRHLLQHLGGWDSQIVGDPTFREREIADQMGIPSPPGRINTVRWIMGRPLQHDPGSTFAYSNIGYLLLGLIIEQVSGRDFLTYVRDDLFKPIGVEASEIISGRTFAKDQNSSEPYYDDDQPAVNVFFPVQSNEILVPFPYGGWHVEAHVSQAGLVTSARVLLTFMNHLMIGGDNVGNPRLPPGNWRQFQIGSLPGVTSVARQRGDGIDYAVLFNKRSGSSEEFGLEIMGIIDSVLDRGAIHDWPKTDPLDEPITATDLQIQIGSVVGVKSTVNGYYYQLESSSDLATWSEFGLPFVGDGNERLISIDTNNHKDRFFRLQIFR